MPSMSSEAMYGPPRQRAASIPRTPSVWAGRFLPGQSSNVDWPRIFQRLKELGYDGTATIEAGNPETGRDQEILGDKAYLEGLIAQG